MPRDDDRNLVQPEGVNAGSGDALRDEGPVADDVLSGGEPEQAAAQDRPRPPTDMAGPARQSGPGPSQGRSVDET